jgi:hypothetical protein
MGLRNSKSASDKKRDRENTDYLLQAFQAHVRGEPLPELSPEKELDHVKWVLEQGRASGLGVKRPE